MIEWEKAKAIADAQQLAAIALLVRRRVANATAMELTRKDGSTYCISLAKARADAVRFTVSEFAVAVTTSEYFAKAKVEEALALYDDLPDVWASLNRGEIPEYAARIIADEVACLDPDKAATVAGEILPSAPGYTPAQLKAALRQGVLKADPDAAFERYARARKQRRVTTRIDEDAMAWFSAYLTGVEMTRLIAIVDAYARMLPDDDGSTLDNRRADALIGLVERGSGLHTEPTPEPSASKPSASGPSTSEPSTSEPSEESSTPVEEQTGSVDPFEERLAADGDAGLKPTVNVEVGIVIGAGTVLGLDNEPGYLAGYGQIPARLGRELIADATWRRMLTDPVSGALLDLGRTRYEPSTALRGFVQERDQTCRFPGCRRKARSCEIDHAIPWPVGTTCKENLECLCSFHHKLKTRGGWKLHLDMDGTCTWTTPTGRQSVTRPPRPGGVSPPTEAKPAPTIPSRTELLRNIAGLPPHGNSPPRNPAGEPPF
jgi:hypothetical protein